ncbi:MAG: pilus assembly protein PilP [Gammaproteobacteria bacterium]|nr:pilus assembly protein PilP [Gammaproteobacteria bacterium]
MKPIVYLAIAGTLVGCQANQDNLSSFVQQTRENAVGVVQPMPEPQEPPSFSLNAAALKDPFRQPTAVALGKDSSTSAASSGGPNLNREREPLENFELQDLQLVGVMEGNRGRWALIREPAGSVHKIQAGNHIGSNFGQVIAVNETGIAIKEWFGDDFSGWRNDSAALEIKQDAESEDGAPGR